MTRGLGRRHPVVAVPFVLGILSLMGFPPTAGFFGKYYVVMAAVEAGGGMVWLAVLLVMTSAVGAYYYLRVIVYLFMRDPAEPEQGAPVAVPMRSGYVAAGLTLSAYFVLRLGLTPGGYLALVGVGGESPPEAWVFLVDAGVALVLAGVAAMVAGARDGSAEAAATGAAQPAHQPSS